MRAVFIVSRRTISPDGRGGASAIHFEQLNALAELGHEIHLWHYCYPKQREEFNRYVEEEPALWQSIQSRCKSITFTTLPSKPTFGNRVSNKLANWWSSDDVINPLFRTVAFPVLRSVIKQSNPDFIWSQHFGATQIASLQTDVPVIYSHHDWLYRIKRSQFNGNGGGPSRLQSAEERVANKAAAVVTGSKVDYDELRTLGCRNVSYIPVSYSPANLRDDAKPFPEARLVHLGGMGTTANRIGLERFFTVVAPKLPCIENFWVVGDTSEASTELVRYLKEVKCTGFVKDLSSVLRPYDLHLIPWEYSTGQRTRMVMAFNYAQVVIAVRASVAGFTEAVDGYNCRLVDRLDQMPQAIEELRHDLVERERLGKAARHTFERCFTRPRLLQRYEAVISSVA